MTITDEQIILFWELFKGRADAYGTYDPETGRAWQVKEPVTAKVIRAHLQGQHPFGVYLLDGERIHAIAADFDQDDPAPPAQFGPLAEEWGLPVYIERSKSKGYHAWTFFDGASGVPAARARRVYLHLLRRIGRPQTEVFPKQDRLDDATRYGNFINAPLFGRLVPRGRGVFLDEDLQPVGNQWLFLPQIRRATEQDLDRIIRDQRLAEQFPRPPIVHGTTPRIPDDGLPPCAQRMLAEGVTAYQRVACFRLACQLRRIGLPHDLAVSTLLAWSRRNRPENGKGQIRAGEVHSQTRAAYRDRMYRSHGCEDPAVTPFCNPNCPVSRARRTAHLPTPTPENPVHPDAGLPAEEHQAPLHNPAASTTR